MANKNNKEQLKRRVISLEDKMDILNRMKNGEKLSSVAKSLNISTSTIATIKHNESKIRKSVAEGYLNGRNVPRVRNIDMIKMENVLMVWLENCIKEKIPVSGDNIKKKALKIYNRLKEMGHSSTEQSFAASDGWLHRFKMRYNLYNTKLQDEHPSAEATDKFKEELQEIIEKGGYCDDQIFNADETTLYWRKLPPRTYISKDQCYASSFNACKERITLLFCSNVAGNCLLKSQLMDESSHPQAMKNDNMSELPVSWHKNTNFKQWFFECFVPSVEDHMQKQNRSFKALLIVDNATCHMKDLYHANIKIVFLPSNCTSLMQPLNQGIIHAFKAIYIRLSLQTILEKLEEDDSKTLMEAWKEFSINDCVNTISLACKELKTSTLNACWKPLLPQMVKDGNVIPSPDEEYGRIINVASCFDNKGLSDINTIDVEEMLKEQGLNEELLIELVDGHTTLNTLIDNNKENISYESSSNINLNGIEEIIDLIKTLEQRIFEYDPVILRSAKFRRELQKHVISYQEFLTKVKNDRVSVPAIDNPDNLA